MCRMQCVLALAALYVGLAHSWDIVVSLGDQLVFYANGSKTDSVKLMFHNVTALVYDEVHDMMLYVNKQSDNDAIYGYNLHTKEEKCFIKRNSSNIHSIAFDPATDTLFFTDTNERSINSITLKPGPVKNVYGNLIIKMDDRTPTDIAVDSCRGYIYWINKIMGKEYKERARFDGSERQNIKRVPQNMPVFSLALDPQTREIYYFDSYSTDPDSEVNVYLNSADFDGRNERVISQDRYLSKPEELTVSNDYLYWMNSSVNYKAVWQIPKYAMAGEEPKEISKFDSDIPLGIAANYKIKDQIQGRQDCEVLSSLIPKNTITNNSLDIEHTTETEQTTEYTTVAERFCVHGIKDSETSVCKCTPGYIGERCVVSVCENYCFQGNCSFNDEGLPKCRCNGGYSGARCEVYACHGYCLNNGGCSLNEEDEPVCQCVGNHEGTRCEAVKDVTFTNTPMHDSAKGDLTLADLFSNWRKLTFVVEK